MLLKTYFNFFAASLKLFLAKCIKLEGGGGKNLVVRPLKTYFYFFAASLKLFLADNFRSHEQIVLNSSIQYFRLGHYFLDIQYMSEKFFCIVSYNIQ